MASVSVAQAVMLTLTQYVKARTRNLGVDIRCTMPLLKMYAVIGGDVQCGGCMMPNRLQPSCAAFMRRTTCMDLEGRDVDQCHANRVGHEWGEITEGDM